MLSRGRKEGVDDADCRRNSMSMYIQDCLRGYLLSIGGRGDMFVVSCVQCKGMDPRI